MAFFRSMGRFAQQLNDIWQSPRIMELRRTADAWRKKGYSGPLILALGTLLATLFIMAFDHSFVMLSNPGLIYLPVVAMLAYHWKWYLAVLAGILQLFCVYFFFIEPFNRFKLLTSQQSAQLIVLFAAMIFVLAIVQLALQGRKHAERAVERLAALNHIGTALTSELDESRLLHLIAETARNLTSAGFAAFTLRPINELGEPLVPSEGNLFYLAAVVGVSKEEETMLSRVGLGGEGLLAPIFRFGVPVRVDDALAHMQKPPEGQALRRVTSEYRRGAQHAAQEFAHGHLGREGLRSMGIPGGHPVVRSFLGAPLLDRNGNVRGGLLLGHIEPGRFSDEDERLLVGLAAEAAVALENARLYKAAQAQAGELDTIFESISDGIMLVDEQGHTLRENRTARALREKLEHVQQEHAHEALSGSDMQGLLQQAVAHALQNDGEQGMPVTVVDEHDESREYIINTSPLHTSTGSLSDTPDTTNKASTEQRSGGAVVVWHDVTEAHRLLLERQAHAETEARRALLQTVIDELPSAVYLVRGHDAHLVLANRAVKEVWGAEWNQGVPLSEFLAQNGIRVFHTDGRPLKLEEFATIRSIQRSASVYHYQEIIRHRDGTTLPVLVNAVAIDSQVLGLNEGKDTADQPEPAAIVVHQNVTALKEAERLKDEFIGIAAHELRNPLAVIKGFAQMLITQTRRGNGPELADWQNEAIQDIDTATSRLVELTEDLLDVTRLQAGRLELSVEPTDLVALVGRIAARIQITTERHCISVSATPEHIVSDVDSRRIEQVVNNLLNNAIKYSPDGGDIVVTLGEDTATKSALLCIEDHGIGIPKAQQARIFSRFMRADNARARDIGGTGLGLYLSRELVERHGGRIWFESIEGEGSRFYVSLPLHTKTSISTSGVFSDAL